MAELEDKEIRTYIWKLALQNDTTNLKKLPQEEQEIFESYRKRIERAKTLPPAGEQWNSI